MKDNPDISVQAIDAAIKSVNYHVLSDGRTTVCEVCMDNGYTVTGWSVAATREGFIPTLGTKYALDDAREKVVELLVFRWRDERMFVEASKPVDPPANPYADLAQALRDGHLVEAQDSVGVWRPTANNLESFASQTPAPFAELLPRGRYRIVVVDDAKKVTDENGKIQVDLTGPEGEERSGAAMVDHDVVDAEMPRQADKTDRELLREATHPLLKHRMFRMALQSLTDQLVPQLEGLGYASVSSYEVTGHLGLLLDILFGPTGARGTRLQREFLRLSGGQDVHFVVPPGEEKLERDPAAQFLRALGRTGSTVDLINVRL